MFRGIATILIISFAVISLPAKAEQSQTFGDYTIHYSAFTTDILSKEVAKSYRISRSKNRALVNISVLKKVMEIHGTPVKANITASATNLSGQLRALKMREIVNEGPYKAVYYIGEVKVDHEETLRYEFTVIPEGEEKPLMLTFQQQFFTR